MSTFATESIAPAGEERIYFQRVFGWMGAGLLVTGGIAGWLGHSQRAMHALFQGDAQSLVIVCIVVELLLVFTLVGLVKHMSFLEAGAVFIGYAALNGVTLSILFAVLTTKSIFSTFLITAAMFGALAFLGYTTKADLTKLGNILLAALFAQIIGVLVNVFWLNSTLYWATTATGIAIFAGLTAYDVQKLKQTEIGGDPNEPAVEKSAIVGALALYLDFINLFLYLIRIFGQSKR